MKKKKIEISVVTPVFNEEKNLKIFKNELEKVFKKMKIKNYEVIFCLDPSKDKSEAIISSFCRENKNYCLIKTSRNFGQAACTMAGIKYSNGKYVVIIDCDLQDPPNLIPKLYNKIKTGYDTVYAERDKRLGLNIFYKIFTYFGYKILNVSSEIKIPKNVGDFRIISRKIVKQLNSLKESNNFLRGLIPLVGFKSTNIKYIRQERKLGYAKYNRYFGSIKIGLNGLIGFSNFLINLIFYLGLIIFMASFVGISFLFYNVFFNNNPYAVGIPSVMVLILFIGSVQLLSLSVIGQYVGKTFEETKQRPKYIIEKKINL